MKFFSVILFCLQCFPVYSNFFATVHQWDNYYNDADALTVASTGRSGSTMLTYCVATTFCGFKILKTHLLPPDTRYKGKILFIFSNPDLSAESALRFCLIDRDFARSHFTNVETSDLEWLKSIGGASKQTLEDNLLAQDALGIERHLQEWLYFSTRPATLDDAQVLAIKYENLWDEETVEAIKSFLECDTFSLPPHRERGYSESKICFKELLFRLAYNLGTPENPIYAAYDGARAVWESAPPFQYLKLLDPIEQNLLDQ